MLKYLVFLIVPAICITARAQSPDLSKMSAEERNAYMTKVRSASAADWQRMMDLLQLKLPGLPAPEADPKRPSQLFRKKDSQSWTDSSDRFYARSAYGNWTNYDDSKVPPYTLPDPLVLKNGTKITNADQWWKLRRPEIIKDYLSEVYGPIPANTPSIKYTETSSDTNVINGKAKLRKIIGAIDNSKLPSAHPRIELSLYTPVNAKKPLPLMVIAWGSFPQPVTNIELLIDKGWAVATFNTGAVQADNGAGLTEGIIGLMNLGKPRGLNEWGVFSAWAWGLMRALDYLEKDKAIDLKRVGIQGHSRWGKTAMWTAALDPRWAYVFSSCSGSLGASLEKRNFGETIDIVAGTGEYHWMTGNFLKYAGNWDAYPVDAHLLMSLIAPRPLFITGGTRDLWADPKGEFLACVAASPVYALLGKKGVGATAMPAPDASLINGELGFRMHEGGHVDGVDWPVFLQFVAKYR